MNDESQFGKQKPLLPQSEPLREPDYIRQGPGWMTFIFRALLWLLLLALVAIAWGQHQAKLLRVPFNGGDLNRPSSLGLRQQRREVGGHDGFGAAVGEQQNVAWLRLPTLRFGFAHRNSFRHE